MTLVDKDKVVGHIILRNPDLDKLGKQLNFSVKVTDVYYECRKNVM